MKTPKVPPFEKGRLGGSATQQALSAGSVAEIFFTANPPPSPFSKGGSL